MERSDTKKGPRAEIPGISVESGLSMVSGSLDTYKRLLEQFLKSYADYTPRITTALDHQDFEKSERMVHNIKSASGYIGANDLFRTSQKLEDEIKESKPHPRLRESFFMQLDQVILSIRNYLDSQAP